MSHPGRDATRAAVARFLERAQRSGTHVSTNLRLAAEDMAIEVYRDVHRAEAERHRIMAGGSRDDMPATLPDGAPTPLESPRVAREVVVPRADDAATRGGWRRGKR